MTDNPILRRYESAKKRREQWNSLLEEAYKYAVPNHTAKEAMEGEKRGSDVYDATAARAVMSRAARLHGSLFPPGREFMDLKPLSSTGIDQDVGTMKKWDEWAGGVRKKFHDAIMASNFHTEIGSILIDVQISTGVLLVREGKPDNPLVFEAVPIVQVIPEASPDGAIRTVFRDFKLKRRDILATWKDGKMPEADHKDDEEKEFEIVEATVWNDDKENYTYVVILKDDEFEIYRKDLLTSPWVVARGARSPGETMGRGPVLAALPDIKTLNKIKEYSLDNAAISIAAPYQYEDDGVFNPDTVELAPREMIPIAPGSKGLVPVPRNGDFSLANMQISELQENIERIISGPGLPPVSEGTKSATEISVRDREQQSVELPSSMRLLTELIYPLCTRVLDILSSPAMANSPFYFQDDQAFLKKIGKPVAMSPLSRMQDQVDVAHALEALQTVASINQEFASLIKMEELTRKLLLMKRFFPDLIYSQEELEEQQKAAQQQQEQMAAVAGQTMQQALSDPLASMAGGQA